MGRWVAERLHDQRGGQAGSVLILGLTFKEDVPDLRNSKVVDVIRRFEALGHEVTIHDPLADPDEAKHEYGAQIDPKALQRRYDIVVAAVPHAEYRAMQAADIESLALPGGCIADLKGIWRERIFDPGLSRWSL